ncbi:MAG: hypothetical protein ABJD57_27245, partial [Roseibium sp.]|uniref:hypothetical protein n=1 Tax=Roseibium sp. TaxID=1936156 RepID=UPI0032672B3B
LDDAQSVLKTLDTLYPFWRSDRNLTLGHTLATMVLRSFKGTKKDQKKQRRSDKYIQMAEQKFYTDKWRQWRQNNQAIVLSLQPMRA